MNNSLKLYSSGVRVLSRGDQFELAYLIGPEVQLLEIEIYCCKVKTVSQCIAQWLLYVQSALRALHYIASTMYLCFDDSHNKKGKAIPVTGREGP
jgi:hypothetical protein